MEVQSLMECVVWSCAGARLEIEEDMETGVDFQKTWGSRYGIRESPRNTAPVAPEEPSGRLPDHPRHSPSLPGTDPGGPREPWKPHLATCYYFFISRLQLFFSFHKWCLTKFKEFVAFD